MKILKGLFVIGIMLMIWGCLTVERQPVYGAIFALGGVALAAPFIVISNVRGSYNDPNH